ncbi:MAG TPA: ABC transporter permease [Casimicrobiaceae bacterium]|jgi:NitT/TauT family transport system permease protein/taurine transport system permease protein
MARDDMRRPAWVGVVTFAALVVLWYALTTWTQTIGSGRFPSPAETYDALRQILVQGYADARLPVHALHSAKLVLLGFAAAVALGVPLGLAMGWSRACEAFVNPTFLLLRPIPPLAWIPLAIVWLGLGDAAKVLVIWFAAFVPAVINSYSGVRSLEPYLVEAARTLGASRRMIVTEVLIPGALPMIFSGLRLSLQACWTTLVAAELIGAIAGLGHVLSQASLDLYPAMIVVGMMAVAVTAALMTLALGVVERRAMPWRKA